MYVGIKEIEYCLPNQIVLNDDLAMNNPDWDVLKVAQKTGVISRHIALANETAFDLAKIALEKMLNSGSIKKQDIDGIIFCTQSPDYLMPSNAFLIHKEFDFSSRVWAFDYNLACSGFVYGLGIAKGMISSNLGSNILLINADTYSKYINPLDRSTSLLFGDAAAVSVIGTSNTLGVIDLILSASGKEFESFYVPAGGFRMPKDETTRVNRKDIAGNIRSLEDIHMNGYAVWRFVSKTVPLQIKELIERNQLSFDQIDQFIFHQASKLTIDSLVDALKVEKSKVFTNIHSVGNTVSASIPIALKDAINQGIVKKGDLVLVSGFGVGLSWGSAIIKI